MDEVDHLRQQKHKPIFNIIEPSIIKPQFTSNNIDASFSSYLHQPNHHQRTEDSDQISIFDAAEYFKGLHDEHKQQQQQQQPQQPDSFSSMARLSSVSSTDTGTNYRARSFHATPTASSEASWSSQTGLLHPNRSGSVGITMISKNPSPNTNNTSALPPTTPTRWSRMGSKWLTPGRNCPCSGKKSVQVEERLEPKTPRMVDLGRSSSSNGTPYTPSLYSIKQSSPKISPSNGNFGPNLMSKKFDYASTISSATTTTATTVTSTIAAKNPIGFSYPRPNGNNNNDNNNRPNGVLPFPSNPKVVGTITASTVATNSVSTNTSAPTTNGFTFPVLENPPVGVKKMFNVIAPDHHPEDPHRDSLEVFQPRSTPRSRRTSYEEDAALSDGSSDLFEIESFSTSNFNQNCIAMKRFGGLACRHSLDEETNGGDEVESVAPTECYAPSEVSIDWSVTTAEGFDRASLANFSVSASEVGYTPLRQEAENNGKDGSGTCNRWRNKGNWNNNGSNGGLLMSCRCEKAVNVGPGPMKCLGPGEGPIPRNPGRNVGGRAKEEGRQGAHIMISASEVGGVGVMVGRSRSNLLPKPFAT